MFRTICFSIFILLLIPAAAFSGSMGPGGPPVVVTARIEQRDITPAAQYIGHVEAVQSVDLRARVEGFLQEIKFKEGDFVSAGATLFVIEREAYKARVAADKARVSQAEAEATRAAARLKRLRGALRESIPATDMDNAIAADLKARAALQEAQAALTLSRLNLSYTVIKAPIAGRIGRVNYTVGNLINPASGPLARLIQVTPIRVVYSISENDLPQVQSAINAGGDKDNPLLHPTLRLGDNNLYPLPGRLDFIDNQVDRATGTIAVRAVFANPKGALVPGQYVTVLTKSTAAKLMPIVPQAAVLAGKDGRFVLMVVNGVATPRPIVIGRQTGNFWAVKSGLQAGDEIIVSGIQKVRPGMPVTVAPSPGQENKK